jgi:branched-chain amino acid transport system ATP-binding protein
VLEGFADSTTDFRPLLLKVRDAAVDVPVIQSYYRSAATIEENLLMGAYTRGSRRQGKQDLERQYSAFPRLADRRRQQAGTLSGGERQMLAFAPALMSRPKLICMDEPTMGLNTGGSGAGIYPTNKPRVWGCSADGRAER